MRSLLLNAKRLGVITVDYAPDQAQQVSTDKYNATIDWSRMQRKMQFLSRNMVLELAMRLSYPVKGNIIEFGVADGYSTRTLRRVLSRLEFAQVSGARKRIFACDSFKGLREKFENAEVGTFACAPPRIRGVEIVEGYFEDSLTDDLARRVAKVAFASLDADLYSSTLCALRWLTPLLVTGSLLLFDEFLGEKESEKRAFEDWSATSGIRTIKIAEFLREPSGWGEQIDRRMLFQVIGDDETLCLVNIRRLTDAWGRFRSLAGRVKRLVSGAKPAI